MNTVWENLVESWNWPISFRWVVGSEMLPIQASPQMLRHKTIHKAHQKHFVHRWANNSIIPYLGCHGYIMVHVLEYWNEAEFQLHWSGHIVNHLRDLVTDVASKHSVNKHNLTHMQQMVTCKIYSVFPKQSSCCLPQWLLHFKSFVSLLLFTNVLNYFSNSSILLQYYRIY